VGSVAVALTNFNKIAPFPGPQKQLDPSGNAYDFLTCRCQVQISAGT